MVTQEIVMEDSINQPQISADVRRSKPVRHEKGGALFAPPW
jgi:hypothetical protein